MLKLANEYDKLAEQADIRSEGCSVTKAVAAQPGSSSGVRYQSPIAHGSGPTV
jgi:hypothetical protein